MRDKEIKETMKATVLANNATERARNATEEVLKKVEINEKLVETLSEAAKNVDIQFAAVKKKIELESNNVRSRVELDKEQLVSRIDELAKLVSIVTVDTEKNRKAYAAYKKQLDELKAKSEKEIVQFIENSKYNRSTNCLWNTFAVGKCGRYTCIYTTYPEPQLF